MHETTALSRVQPGSLTIPGANDPFALPNIFWKFRDVMQAPWCRLRKIYYVEEGFGGRARLREVQQWPRSHPGEDHVLKIWKGPVDIDEVKAMIANANAGQLLTGVRWELYAGSELTELVEMGRFDIVDLLPDSFDRVKALFDTIDIDLDVRSGALDFDHLVGIHTCPVCHHHTFGTDLLVYIPKWMYCTNCKLNGWNDDTPRMKPVFEVIRRLKVTSHIFPAEVADDAPVEMRFIEITATPALAQLVQHSFIGFGGVYSDAMHESLTPELVRKLYDRSLFALLRIDVIREEFKRRMARHFQERIESLKTDELPEAYRGRGDDATWRAWLINGWQESQEHFEATTDILARLDEFLFQADTKDKDNLGLFTRIVGAIGDFAHYMEDLLALIWDEQFNQPTTIRPMEVLSE